MSKKKKNKITKWEMAAAASSLIALTLAILAATVFRVDKMAVCEKVTAYNVSNAYGIPEDVFMKLNKEIVDKNCRDALGVK